MTDYQETIWFEMTPDVYGGETCDQVVPRWHGYANGDKESDVQHDPLTLDPRHFPPGTKIVVSEPTCPDCHEPRGFASMNPIKFKPKCDCGFDWEGWVLDQYS